MIKGRKVHSLTGRITENRMHKAFKTVKKNRGVAGIDNVSISMFEQNLDQNLTKLMKDLKGGSFKAIPLRRKHIPKAPGKFRPLGIPAVRDRVAQEVIRSLIEPYFEPNFSDFSFGFRPNRNCHQAIKQLLKYWKLGYNIVLDADIQSFFDNIEHELIIDLLANIVLDVLDRELAKHGLIFVRYADDFLVLSKSTPDIEKAYEIVQNTIENVLKLKLEPSKTKITSFKQGFDFLGFTFSSHGISMRTKSVKKLKDKIRKLTIRSHNFSGDVIEKLNRVTRGVANYYETEFSTVNKQFNYLDQMIRRRLRCMKKNRISARDNFSITNKYFERKGLVSLCSYLSKN